MAKILILDDDISILKETAKNLGILGHEIIYIARPDFLFQRLETETIDLILMDVDMPIIDGISLLKQLKAHPIHRKISVIMMTADSDEDVIRKSLENGASEFIQKPLNQLALQTRVKMALSILEKNLEMTE